MRRLFLMAVFHSGKELDACNLSFSGGDKKEFVHTIHVWIQYTVCVLYCSVCILYEYRTLYSVHWTLHSVQNLWWISISSRLAKQSGGMIILTSSIFSQQWFPFMMLNYAIMILTACNKYDGKADWKVRPVKTNIWEKHAKILHGNQCNLKL